MKKLYSILLIMFLAFPITVSAAVFSDISNTHPNLRAIEYLKGSGVIQGYETTTLPLAEFRPDNGVNRAELLKMVFLATGLTPPESCAVKPFPDVPKEEWFCPYVFLAKELGVVQGYPNGTFRPGNPVNRPEAMKIILKQIFRDSVEDEELTDEKLEELKKASCEPQGFSPDLKKEWFWIYVNFANNRCLLDQKTLASSIGEPMSRGEVAEMIFRAKTLVNLASEEVIAYKNSLIPSDFIYNVYKIVLPPLTKVGYPVIIQDKIAGLDPNVSNGRLINISFNKLAEMFFGEEEGQPREQGVKLRPGVSLLIIYYNYKAQNIELEGLVTDLQWRQTVLKSKNFEHGKPCPAEVMEKLNNLSGGLNVGCTALLIKSKRGLLLDIPAGTGENANPPFKLKIIFFKDYALMASMFSMQEIPQEAIGSPDEELLRTLNQISQDFLDAISVR